MRYPLATRGIPTATTYGTHDPLLPLALTWHTTETGSWPGYRLGRVAPHHTYKAVSREWRWHGAPADQRVGTMRSSLWTRTPANEKAYQVEIIAYSNRTIADQSAGRIWVGDFTEAHYRDLAAFAAWLATVTSIDMGQVTPTPPGGWTPGSASPHRLSRDDWLAFNGMTAHGAVTGQSHWDTGVLDLARISAYKTPTLEDDMVVRAAMQAQTEDFYVWLQEVTTHPKGNDPGYWGRTGQPGGPTDAEWDNPTDDFPTVLDELFTAAISAGALHHDGELPPIFPLHDHDADYAAKADHPHSATTTID